MKSVRICLIPFLLAVLAAAVPLQADTHYTFSKAPKTEIYFGHISYSEIEKDSLDPVVIRGDFSPIPAVLNLPILPGDVIRTSGSRRCEIQFDTGTLIRLDFNTELKIETILAPSLSSRDRISNMVLSRGQVFVMYKNYGPKELFQIITPNAAVRFNKGSVGTVSMASAEGTAIHLKRGKAFALFGEDAESLKEDEIKKGHPLVITEHHKSIPPDFGPDAVFAQWNDYMNKNFAAIHKGKSKIPKPLERYSRAVIYFAEKFANTYGEWKWSDLYGYVWRPNYNDIYPWGGWMPYFYGSWRQVNGDMYWVPQEPWGWVPYHLGLWAWDEDWGWYWIPGSVFASHWTLWTFFDDFYAWRPWGLSDWFYYDSFFSNSYMFHVWNQYNPDPFWPGNGSGTKKEIGKVIYKEQLAKNNPPVIPPEMKKIYKKIAAAVKKGDTKFLAAMKIPAEGTVIRRKDVEIPKIDRAAYSMARLPYDVKMRMNRGPVDHSAHISAAEGIQKEHFIKTYGERFVIGWKHPAFMKPSSLPARSIRHNPVTRIHRQALNPVNRFRDWNQDVFVARKAGVSIHYLSMKNEIRCPELKVTSKNVSSRVNISSLTGMSVSGGYGGGSGGSSFSGSSNDSHTGNISTRAGGERSGGGPGGKGKKD